MKLPKQNKDLAHYVRKKWGFRFFLFATWIVLSYLGTNAYNRAHETYPKEELVLGWKLAFFMTISTLIAFLIFRIFEVSKLKRIEGVIESTGISHTYTASEDPGIGSSTQLEFRTNTYLKIRTDKGKLKKIKFEQKNGFYLYYYPGTYVCLFSGLPYPLADPNRTIRPEKNFRYSRTEEDLADDLSRCYLCVACGRLNRSQTEPCEVCGMSLVNPSDIFS